MFILSCAFIATDCLAGSTPVSTSTADHSRIVREVAQAVKILSLLLIKRRLRVVREQSIPALAKPPPDRLRVLARQVSLVALPVHSRDTTAIIIQLEIFRHRTLLRKLAQTCHSSLSLTMTCLSQLSHGMTDARATSDLLRFYYSTSYHTTKELADLPRPGCRV